ncbi:gamma-glutamyltranspeptidase [Talaromyces stipitatus ATCC 10500]|uniref:Glutathione hydrolase n=1 Tax=Talaromyces stipitatus (strain ATCC 10500 / CBS 375.48 / QM 6759 / NRRL 1006) TaxID=441959 RepID=B8MB48_TALSN|nr:gamma-glutamyltranspeptidase [Talaromyces stipitatus ATCC 10500]EED18749.1 gamma-glutamyltranspeptidase [Talaromyces stipitatus ATCC 10500]
MAPIHVAVSDSEKQLLIPPTSDHKPNSRRSGRVILIVKIAITATAAVLYLFILFPTLRTYILPKSWRATSNTLNQDGDASLGAVSSESSICSAAGIDMLKMGGNAADAMVATVFCVGVIGMYHSGIGGGGFVLVRSPDGTFEHVDFRETAPAAAFQDMFNDNKQASVVGGLASGVPGEVRGLEYIHTKYGTLPWSTILQPAIKVARDGFVITTDLSRAINASVRDHGDFLSTDPSWALDFAPNSTLLGLGDTIYRKRYADTLEKIATEGPDAFYIGPIAEAIIRATREANGTMTLDDLRRYEVLIRDTKEIDYRGYKITTTSAPSSGTVGLSILKIVEGYSDFFHPETMNLSTHRLDEAMRFAYGQRTSFGDPSFLRDLHQREEDMLNDTVASAIRGRISDFHTQNVSAYNPDGLESLDTPGTSHVSTADRSGLALSLTTTINLFFGNLIMVPETGIIMNNEMDDFSIPGSSNQFGYAPSPSNYIQPGKRPLSSITPIIVENADGSLYFVTGAAGGSRIITATVQSVINLIDRGMTPLQALLEPRLHDQLIPNVVALEPDFDQDIARFLKSRGHNVTELMVSASSAQCVRLLPNGTFEAAGEPRQRSSGGFAI